MLSDLSIARKLSFRHLRAFACVAQTGSFTKAAEQLAMSQPALTLNIRQFEEIVGVPLFNRTTRTVSLTAAGQSMLDDVKALLSGFDSAVHKIRANASIQNNHINVAVLPSVAIRLLPGAVGDFTRLRPDVTIQLRDDNGRGVQSQILNGDADFGISSVWERHPDLQFMPLVRDRLGLICRNTHPLARVKGKVNWADIKTYPFVGMADDTGVGRLMRAYEEIPDAIQKPAASVLTIAALVGLLESDKTISALPALAAPDYLNPSLVYRDLAKPMLYRELCLITSTKQPLRTTAELFYQYLKDHRTKICAAFPNNTVVPCLSEPAA